MAVKRGPLRPLTAVLLATSCLGTLAHANPIGGVVAAGTATIASPSAGSLVITTQTARTIINWQSFSIGRSESVLVNQPNAGSILLDRVVPGGPASFLMGKLSSNGQLVLINQAGIVIGPGAQITAAQLLLTTHSLSDASFLGGGTLDFNITGDPNSKVVNHGTLTATGGAAILAGDRVKNDGVIVAELGSVVLGAAKTYTVDFSGDGLLQFAVTTPVDQVAPGAKALVENSGTISAHGGAVLLTAAAAKGVIDNVINTSGIVEATSVAKVNGQIVLSGSGGGTEVSGTLDASGKGAGETGGSVAVTGDTVTLAPGAKIDVSGDAGGGSAFIGGNGVAAVTMAQGASIIADGIDSGDGGTVKVLSDGTTKFAGAITARGGARGGNGGSVETSGKQLAFAGGIVRTGAAHGHAGTWLLDPYDLTIDAAGAATLDAALADGNVIVTTSTAGASGFGSVDAGGSGDITVASAITWQSANALMLSAYRDINVTAPITSLGGGDVTLQADNTHTGTGIVAIDGGSIATAGTVSIFEPPPGNDITYYAPHVTSSWLLVSYVDDDISTFSGNGSGARATFPGSDLVLWGQFGAVDTAVSDGSTATSQNGVPVTVSGQVPGAITRRDEGNGWSGTFQTGDQLLFYTTSGTVRLGFPTGVGTVGVQIESDQGSSPPTFTAVATIFNGGTQLASLMGSGQAGACGGCNNAPFFGFVDNSGSNITSMTVGLAANDSAGFSINQLSLGGAGTGSPGGGGPSPTPSTNVVQQVAQQTNPVVPVSLVLPPPPPVVQGGGGAPPPPLPAAAATPTGDITNVSQIDTGGQAFSQITGGGSTGPTEPIAQVPPVTPAPQAQPKPQVSDVAVGGRGSGLFQSKPVFLFPPGVPGIDDPTASSGNRSLWGGAAA